MNNKKIIDYVMQSPNNTNPAVLESMLEAINGNSGGGTSGGAKVFRLGIPLAEIENRESASMGDGVNLIKISDQIPTVEEVANAILFTSRRDSSTGDHYIEHKLIYMNEGDVILGLAVDESDELFGGYPVAVLMTEELANMLGASAGLYLVNVFCIASETSSRPNYFAYGITDIS